MILVRGHSVLKYVPKHLILWLTPRVLKDFISDNNSSVGENVCFLLKIVLM